jgi:putative SOS response-associated peptidase YedK
MLSPDLSEGWLRGNTNDASEILNSMPLLKFQYYPVSTQVNSARNQGASLVEPIAFGDLFSELD